MKRNLQETENQSSTNPKETNQESNETGEDFVKEGAEDVSVSSGLPKKKKRHSAAWNHFSITIDETAEKNEWADCNYCAK